jgi:hypothetical protein
LPCERNTAFDAAVIALDQLLGLAHAGGGIALRVLEQEFDRAPEHAALGVDHFLHQLAGAHDLAAEQRIAAGDDRRDADLDRLALRAGSADERRQAQCAGGGRALQDAAPRDVLFAHCVPPPLVIGSINPGSRCRTRPAK